MIKNCKRFKMFRVPTAKQARLQFAVLPPTYLVQLSSLLLLLIASASAWGQFFESPPRVIDDAHEDIVFSPNGDGIQDNLIIGFVTNGFTGDYRIIIDVHGPIAVGRPDGVFDIDDDWVVFGAVGPGPSEFYPENNPKIVHLEWDGMDRSPNQVAPPNARPVSPGRYEIRVETDAFENGAIDVNNPTYQSTTLIAVVDTKAPDMSGSFSNHFFSPNSDSTKDATTITYKLSEHLSKLSLEFADLEGQPSIELRQMSTGSQSFDWNGRDGLGTPLTDGTYNLRLRGIDNGGNVTTFDVGSVQIDTEAPSFALITPSQNAFLNTSVAAVEVGFNPEDQGSPIDFNPIVTSIGLRAAGGISVSGITRSDVANNRLTLILDSPLDTISENGTYTAVILVTDEAGNQAETETRFHFDTVPPTLTRLRSNLDDFRPSGSVNTKITFVEVDLDDNIDGGLNLSASTIALNGPNGAIFGNQTFGGERTLRWTLKTPIATDGSEDGIYTITINAADRAGNTSDFGEISFVYDTIAPRLVSLTPNLEDSSLHLGGGAIFRSQPLLRIDAGFDDGDGSGVDLASTRLEIFRPDDSGVGNVRLAGTRHLNTTDGTLAFLLSQPLENQDGTQDGVYTVRVTSADVAGNSAARQVDLVYDTETPTIVSVAPAQDATVTTLSEVTLVMNDRTSGVDFGNTQFKLVRDDVEISANSSNNGIDTAILTLSNPLRADGSDDGEYRIEITTVDRAGNASDQIARRLFFVSRRPEIRLIAPAGKEVNELATVEVQLFDYIGTGIDYSADKSSVIVIRPDGMVLPAASVEADTANRRLIWMAENPLPRDGSADGEYAVNVNFEDNVGQNFTQEFALTFDTQVPRVAQTTPTAGARIAELGTIVINFAGDLSGVDFSAVQVRLLDPNGEAVRTSRSDNGVDAITLRVQELQGSAVGGVYTIEVTSADRAGNVADSPFLSGFTYAPHKPSILLQPPTNLPTNQLNQITATLQDYVGPGIDFDATETSISVRNTNGVVIASHPIQYDETELQMTWTALSPLPRDGSADGEYEVASRFAENFGLGTTSPASFEQVSTLVVDTQPAKIVSTIPMQNARIAQLNLATITLEDNLSGVDFDRTLARLLNSANNPIPTNTSNDGVKQISLSFDPFQTDGSADGVYRLEITPVDLAGNVGGVSIVEFVYATQVPEIEMLTPTDGSVINRVTEIRVLIRDNSGEGIDLEKSVIRLSDASGADVPGVLGNDGEQTVALRLRLPTDGSADGTYTVNLNVVDNLGVEAGYTRQFMYDSVPPALIAESSPPRENIIGDNRIVEEFEVTDPSPVPGAESGVDFDATTIQLHDANGEPVAGEQRDDGEKLIKFTSAELTGVGVYTLTVVVADRAGNVGVPQRFTYSDEIKPPPRVTSISPLAKSRVNHLTEISVVLEDRSGTGIDFSAAGSTIELRSPDGVVVGGVVSNNGADTMTLNLMDSLLTDGSDDGVYTVSVQPVDLLGVSGHVRQFTITYDTQSPRVQSVSHIDMTANVSNISDSIRRIETELIDNVSGIDYENSSVQLWRHSENELVLVPGTPDNDGSLVWWQLEAPLGRDGTDDGVYTVTVEAADDAGNVEERAFRFLYDTQVPVVRSIHASAVAGDSLELDMSGNPSVVEVPIHQIHLVFSDGSGSGIDVTHMTVQIFNPNDVVVGATRQVVGLDEITLVFDSFKTDGSADGVYRLEITPVDLAGNVGGVSIVEFVYATQVPEIEMLTPTDGSVINRVTEIRVLIRDNSGEGIDLEKSVIRLSDASGADVPGVLGNDGEQTVALRLRLPTDGSADGTYTVNLNVVDNLGVEAGYTRQFMYDSVPPALIAESSPPRENIIGDNRIVEEFEVTDPSPVPGAESGVDFDATTIQLHDANGEPVAGEQRDDGEKLIKFTSAELTGVGVYTLTVVVADRAGNVGVPQRFTYSDEIKPPPRVTSISPLAKSRVNHLTEISVVLEDRSGTGIDFSAAGSTIELRSPDGVVVGGVVSNNGADTMTLNLMDSLLTDGSDDGVYTVSVQPVDLLGVSGHVRQFTITYDTQSPRVQSVSHIDMTANVSNISDSIRRIETELIDNVSGIDFEHSFVQLWRHSENELVLVPGSLDDDGTLMWWQLEAPLGRDGTDDGMYTVEVEAADNAGNVEQKEFRFLYGTQAPVIRSVSPQMKSRLNRLTEITAVVEDRSGTGIDYSPTGSTIELRGPDDVAVEGIIADDGADTMTLNLLAPLLIDGSDDGVYTITVQPVDHRGVSGEVRQFTITYDTQSPRIQSVSHIDMAANVSLVKDSVRRVEAEFSETGSGIDYENSSVQLWRHAESERVLVPGTLGDDGTLLWWQLDNPLVRSGEDDGVYTIQITAVDHAGNAEETEFSFLYDTQRPMISFVQASAVAGDTLELDASGSRSIVELPINQILLAFSDGAGSGIDVSQTTVLLIYSDEIEVAATRHSDGIETISLRFSPLRDDGMDDGRYIIRVTPVDLAGNAFSSPIELPFLYITRKPEIVSTSPAEHTSINTLNSVSATLLDHTGEGIDFDRSTVVLNNSEGNSIDGHQRVDMEGSVITWELDQPLSRDGVDDGEYSIRIVAIDGVGSELESTRKFLYDSRIPRIVSVSANTNPPTSIPANELVVLNRSISQMTVGLSDENTDSEQIPTSGVNFLGTTVRLIGPDNVDSGITLSDDGEAKLIVRFTPLVQPGVYRLEISPRDHAGNASGHAIQYNFRLDFAKPRVDSMLIGEHTAPVAYVNQLQRIAATLVDSNEVGLDLTSGGSTLQVLGPHGVVDGLQEGRGNDELVWTPLHIPEDGTADGRYTVTVTPVDNLGLIGAPVRYEFVLDTQNPELVGVSPIDLTRAVSYIGAQIIQISAQVADVGPAGLDILAQTVHLQNADGSSVPADLTSDGDSQLFLTLAQPLATNGSNDGEYSVVISLGDRAGNTLEIQHTFVYDTQAPTLVNTDPAGDLIRDDLTAITADLHDLGGSGIDFTASHLTLFDPNDNPVSGKLSNDGVAQLALNLDELAEDGNYRIRVVAVDRAGNGANAPFDRTFLFSTNLPTVVSTTPVTAPADSAFIRTPPNQVEVEFQSTPNLSTVKLIHPNGTTVPGQQIRDGNRLIYRLSRELASDGSDDGSYMIVVTPVNSAGRSGEQQQYNFIYDTVPPEVDGVLPIVESPGVNNALNEILAAVSDAAPSSSIDWDRLDDSWMTFEKVGVGKKIRGRITSDRDQLISFRLESPLASDGSQDGEYRVTVIPRDRAGNAAIPTVLEFFLDTRPPVIHTDSLLINDRPLLVDTNHPDYPSADGSGSGVVIQARMSDTRSGANEGLGVDLSQSSIVVTAPDGELLTGNLTQNGTDTIVFRSGPLIARGYYQVEITSVGLDVDGLGFAPSNSITTRFLHETTKPVAELTDFGGKTSLTDQPLPLRGTAADPVSAVEEGTGGGPSGTVAPSGIAFVEIIGTGPDGEPIEPVIAIDESGAESEPWSNWSLDYLPARSGGYHLDVRVTDRAGNVAIYEGVNVNLAVSLTYRGSTYSWPNPLNRAAGDSAHFSFDVNLPSGSKINMTLSIYDFAGDLVYESMFPNISPGRDSDQLVTWDLKNQVGAAVARGVYIFRLEAEDVVTNNRSNAVGKMLVIE